MTPVEVAELLERYAGKVRQIRGVSRRNPHVFAEDKSELAGEMLDEARRLRTPDKRHPDLDSFRSGTIRVGSRDVRVERRKAS